MTIETDIRARIEEILTEARQKWEICTGNLALVMAATDVGHANELAVDIADAAFDGMVLTERALELEELLVAGAKEK